MTLSVFLIAYYIFLGLFILFSLFAIYHLVLFIPPSSAAFFTLYVFLAGAAIIIFATWQEIQIVDWAQSFFTLNFSL
ncbi:hypothetical protein KKD80_02635 [Patescibacteria group bacterium]|nr:hypothetical protein [Patescibacteria group bacterium]